MASTSPGAVASATQFLRRLFRLGPKLPEGPLDMRTMLPEMFDPLIGQTVVARNEDGVIEFRLVDVRRGQPPIPGVRERPSFTLVMMCDEVPKSRFSILVTLEFPKLGILEAVSIEPNSGAPDPSWGTGQMWAAVFG